MLVNYLRGITDPNAPKSGSVDITTVLLIFSAFAAGYTATDFPPKFLDFLYTPVGQFITYYSLIYLTYKSDPTVTQNDMILEAVIGVILMQVSKRLLYKYL